MVIIENSTLLSYLSFKEFKSKLLIERRYTHYCKLNLKKNELFNLKDVKKQTITNKTISNMSEKFQIAEKS
jgi:hypothetical protein